jgi:hypothetical protein
MSNVKFQKAVRDLIEKTIIRAIREIRGRFAKRD